MLLIILLSLFGGCKINNMFGDKQMTNYDKLNPYISLNTLNVYKIKNVFVITLYLNNSKQSVVEFSSDRTCNILNQNIKLLNEDEINQYLDVDINHLVNELGEPHADIGSGFYIPAYITSNGYLIYFKLDNDIVFEVTKMDLLNNKIVDTV